MTPKKNPENHMINRVLFSFKMLKVASPRTEPTEFLTFQEPFKIRVKPLLI